MKIGNGRSTYAWFDNWSPLGLLSSFVSNRNLYEANLNHNDTVADMVTNGTWKWPEEWYKKWPQFATIQTPPMFSEVADKLLWKNNGVKEIPFTIHDIWKD